MSELIPGATAAGMSTMQCTELLETAQDTFSAVTSTLTYLLDQESKKAQPDTVLIAEWEALDDEPHGRERAQRAPGGGGRRASPGAAREPRRHRHRHGKPQPLSLSGRAADRPARRHDGALGRCRLRGSRPWRSFQRLAGRPRQLAGAEAPGNVRMETTFDTEYTEARRSQR